MKAYFTASVRGKRDYLENYKLVIRCLEGRGFKVYADHIISEGIEEVVSRQSEEERVKVYKQTQDKIKSSDLVVAEISSPSISVGHEITYALELSKPVIVFHVPGRTAPLLEGRKDEKLQIISYEADQLKRLLGEAIEEAKKMTDVRFNFFVSPKILSYLDWVAKHRMIPRSVFLRDLIEREMRKDKDFKG